MAYLPGFDSDPDSETDSCPMQNFSTGSDSDSDSLIEMYVIRTEICPSNEYSNGSFTLPDPDSDPYSDPSCTMQKFHIGSDSDSDPLIEMHVVGTEICPLNGYSNHLGNHLSRNLDLDLNQCESSE